MHRRAFLQLLPVVALGFVRPAEAGGARDYAAAFAALPASDRQRIQTVLVLADLYQGDLDGLWGPETAEAIALSVRHIIRRSQGQDLPDVSTAAARASYLHGLAHHRYDIWLTADPPLCLTCGLD